MTTDLIDRYMCTDTCPCLEYGANPSSKELYMNSKDLAKYNRTFDPTDKSKIFMKFTKNNEFAFKNFDDCFNHWFKKVDNDKNLNIREIF